MNERNLYRGLNNFEGSIDENGNLYDECHRLVGRIEGNDVYDYCNNKQGTIDECGKLWDINHTYVGEARGNDFIGPSYQSTGMVRGDSFDEGNGCEYGALMMLKKRNQHHSGNMPDNDYNFPNNDDDEADDEDGEEQEDYDGSMGDDWEDHKPRATPHHKSRWNGGGRCEHDDISDVAGCVSFLVVVLFIGSLICYLLSSEVKMY